MLRDNKKYLVVVEDNIPEKGGMLYLARIYFDDYDCAVAEYMFIRDEIKQKCKLLDRRYREIVI